MSLSVLIQGAIKSSKQGNSVLNNSLPSQSRIDSARPRRLAILIAHGQ
jgi:hypothetical protein